MCSPHLAVVKTDIWRDKSSTLILGRGVPSTESDSSSNLLFSAGKGLSKGETIFDAATTGLRRPELVLETSLGV